MWCIRGFQGLFLCGVLLSLAGCDREEIKSYRVPKEQPPQVSSPSMPMPAGHPDVHSQARAKPKLSWTLPPGWEHLGEGQMSLASFKVTAKNGKQAQVAVTPLPNMSSREDVVVNMWRQQAHLPELSADEVQKQLKPVTVGDEQGKMFEVSRPGEGTNAPMSIVTAMVHHPDASWFYKLQGEPEAVEAAKGDFLDFLKSIKITEAAADTVSAPPPTGAADGTKWAVPSEWKVVAPGQMQVAKFAIPEKNGAKADVTVSVFPTSTGDLTGNINRWRGQIGLAAVDKAEVDKFVTPLDSKIAESVLVDMVNGKRQLIGAIVPRAGQWYFYKLLGDAEAVAPQKEAFLKFAKSEP